MHPAEILQACSYFTNSVVNVLGLDAGTQVFLTRMRLCISAYWVNISMLLLQDCDPVLSSMDN